MAYILRGILGKESKKNSQIISICTTFQNALYFSPSFVTKVMIFCIFVIFLNLKQASQVWKMSLHLSSGLLCPSFFTIRVKGDLSCDEKWSFRSVFISLSSCQENWTLITGTIYSRVHTGQNHFKCSNPFFCQHRCKAMVLSKCYIFKYKNKCYIYFYR